MILLGVLRSVQQRQRLALRQRRQPQARFAMGVELLTIALAEVGEIDRLAVKGFAQLSGRALTPYTTHHRPAPLF